MYIQLRIQAVYPSDSHAVYVGASIATIAENHRVDS
jgi:hypothetical protein